MTFILIVSGLNLCEEHTISLEKFSECALEIHFIICQVIPFAPSMDFFEEEEVEIGTFFHGLKCFRVYYFFFFIQI